MLTHEEASEINEANKAFVLYQKQTREIGRYFATCINNHNKRVKESLERRRRCQAGEEQPEGE